ncbi:MAG: zf-HC2 domain-containing protein [Pseudomonadota bacterium]
MTETAHSDTRRRIDAYFAGELDAGGLRELRAHVADCDECRRVYDERAGQERAVLGEGAERLSAHRVLQAVLADPAVQARPREQRRWWAAFVLAPAAALAAALVFTIAIPDRDSGLVARGGDAAVVEQGFGVAAVDPNTGLVVDARRPEGVPLDQRLRFSARCNDPSRNRLFLFGVDDALQPFWYYPLPDEGQSISLSVAAAPQALPYETELGRRHHAGRLRLVALFSAQPIRLDAIEGLLAAARARGEDLAQITWPGSPVVQIENVLLVDRAAP